MKLGLKRDVVSGGVPVFQWVDRTAQGGFTLDKTSYADGDVIPAGTPIAFDEGTRIARPVKALTTNALAGNTDVAYHVKKGSAPKVGDIYSPTPGGVAHAVTAVDTTNADYDLVTFDTTLGITASGTTLFQSSAAGATAGAYVGTPKGLLYEDTVVGDDDTISVVLEGSVYARRIPAYHSGIPALMPNINFSQSF